jgi:hypothetical protein
MYYGMCQGWRNFLMTRAQIFYKFRMYFSRAYGNIVEENKVLESSIIIIKYCMIINAYYNYVINMLDNYYVSNTGNLEECDKEENLAVTVAATTSCLKRRLKRFVQCHVLVRSPPGRRPVINIQSTLRTATGLCQNISLIILFGSNDNSYTVPRQSGVCMYVCMYTHIHHNVERLVRQKK